MSSEPGTQPADAGAPVVGWTPAPDPTRTSAFAGQVLAPAHTHAGHAGHHGGHGDHAGDGRPAPTTPAPAGDEPKPFTTDPEASEEPTR